MQKFTLPNILLAALCLSVASVEPAYAQSVGSPARLSQSAAGDGGNAASDAMTISPNGRFVAYQSQASNLITPSTNGQTHIFLRDTADNSVRLISRRIPNVYAANPAPVSGADQGDDGSFNPAASTVTPNGVFGVAFESDASNISNYTDSGFRDIFLYVHESDARPEFLERISFGAPAVAGDFPVATNDDSQSPSLAISGSPDTAFIAFSSDASNLIAGATETNNRRDIYLVTLRLPLTTATGIDFDLQHHYTIKRLSSAASGGESNGDSNAPKISGAANAVVFVSSASNLVAGLDPQHNEVYLYDLVTNQLSMISKGSDGHSGDADSGSAAISYNGRYVFYTTKATNILPDNGGPAGAMKIVRFDRQTGVTEQVNRTTSVIGDGTQNSDSRVRPGGNGRFVTFTDNSTNLDSNSQSGSNVYLKDMTTGALTLLSKSTSGGKADDDSFGSAIGNSSFTGNSATLGFTSFASNLVSGDDEGRPDVFLQSASSFASRALSKNLGVEVPADVSSPSKGRIKIQGEAFVIASAVTERGLVQLAGKAKKATIQYEFTAKPIKIKKQTTVKEIVKKNQITLRNLKPGSYNVSYRAVMFNKNGKKQFASAASPAVRITIQGK